jgi:hypothetical protein
MSIFDLLLIALFLSSVATLLTVAFLATTGRRTQALRILRRYAICFVIYLSIVFIVAFVTPRRIVSPGANRCFDDWCIAVERPVRVETPTGVSYAVTFRVSSEARRVTQREKNIAVYLTDDRDRRFDPRPAPSEIPFDVSLEPGQAVETMRSFLIPNDARNVGAVIYHQGAYCFPGCVIIGEEGNPLRKRAIVPLP